MRDEEKAKKLIDVVSDIASKVIEQRLSNVVQTVLAVVVSVVSDPNGNDVHTVRLTSSNSDEFECPKMCLNKLSPGDYVWLHYVGDVTNSYIAVPVIPTGLSASDVTVSDFVLYPATATTLGGVRVGTGLQSNGSGILSVNTATSAQEDNMSPISSDAVFKEIGNINLLLESL